MLNETTIEAWNNSFQSEQQTFDSDYICAEMKIREALQAIGPEEKGSPSRVVAQVYCEVLEQVAHIFSRFEPVVRLALGPIMNAIFIGEDHSLTYFEIMATQSSHIEYQRSELAHQVVTARGLGQNWDVKN